MTKPNAPSAQRKVLEEERARTATEIERLKSLISYSIEVTSEDGDPEIWEREKNLALIHTLQVKVAEIDRALRKLHGGQYGTCERCGKPIDPARLKAMPTATMCLKCKQELERATRMQSQREV